MTLYLYKVDTDYVKYLHSIDKKIQYYQGHHDKSYVGIVLNMGNFDYFVPLSSPKEKHKVLKENQTLTKIKDGNLGVLNHNNMIPVLKPEYKILDIKKQEYKYRGLLEKQQEALRTIEDNIQRKSNILYNLITNHPNDNKKLLNLCCDFKTLEDACLKYKHEKSTI